MLGANYQSKHICFCSENNMQNQGFEIAEKYLEEARKSPLIEVWVNTTALGLYEDKVLTV